MRAEILTLDLSFRRRSIIGYSIGLALYVLVVVVLYPAFRNSTELDQLATSSPGVAAIFGIAGSLTSPTGWMNANVYANFFPLIVLLLAVGYGGAGTAGQEDDGHLELILALPFARARVLGEKIACLVAQVGILAVAVFATVLVGRWFQLTIALGPLAASTLAVMLLGVDFGLLALAIGAGTGNRGVAIGITSALAAASYLLNAMAPLVHWLSSARYVSLFYWSVGNNQLDDGVSITAFAVLAGVAVVLAVAALRAFEHHDLH